eukprot:scaffold54172_cov29-Phaeocystis_antarctica.AAC.1
MAACGPWRLRRKIGYWKPLLLEICPEYTGARAHTQMPRWDRSSAGDHAFFDAAPWVGCLLMMIARPARRS